MFDGHDENPSCDNNRWSGNQFATVNQPCVATGAPAAFPSAHMTLSKEASPTSGDAPLPVTYTCTLVNDCTAGIGPTPVRDQGERPNGVLDASLFAVHTTPWSRAAIS